MSLKKYRIFLLLVDDNLYMNICFHTAYLVRYQRSCRICSLSNQLNGFEHLQDLSCYHTLKILTTHVWRLFKTSISIESTYYSLLIKYIVKKLHYTPCDTANNSVLVNVLVLSNTFRHYFMFVLDFDYSTECYNILNLGSFATVQISQVLVSHSSPREKI